MYDPPWLALALGDRSHTEPNNFPMDGPQVRSHDAKRLFRTWHLALESPATASHV